MNSKLVKKKLGGTNTYSLGQGNPMVVIHGGPGLDHTYLTSFLAPIGELRELVFYDQLGCGPGSKLPKNFSLDLLFSQFTKIAEHLSIRKEVDVLAHSWGAYIFYEAIRLRRDIKFGHAILVSPVGLTRKRFDQSGDRLIRKVPKKILAEIEKMNPENIGPEIMNLISPYYLANPRGTKPVEFTSYNSKTYDEVIEVLHDFDCRGIARELPEKTKLIYGEKDIELPKDTREIHRAVSVAIISDAGHFVFSEKQSEFMKTVLSFLSDQ